MSLELNLGIKLDIEILDERDLLESFKLFCLAHEIEEPEDIIKRFSAWGLVDFLKSEREISRTIYDSKAQQLGNFSMQYFDNAREIIFSGNCNDCNREHRTRYRNALRKYYRQLKLF
jgi:hypothetical protein